ncbi:MFS transporter [Pelosinus baikalensis]|uniref:MFS transporter n=1 Tax=Pelosinus baikalensis TaxID=2892015 RepID=A0ABS8HT32_9FIRM|nr:MFS transporter [Pelosinus baikalensis]MCC5466333.1 MFS transporter [Pelosinus baikalensis]
MARKVTLKNIIGYASVNFLGGGAQFLISAWLMYFYTTMCNMSAVQAGLIFTVARLLDAVGNPIMGFITDNFRNTRLGRKFGRRRFFILMGIPTITIIFPLLWITGQSFTYYLIMNLIYEAIFTMVIVPCSTLPAEMTQDAGDKAKLTGTKQFFGTVANTIAAFIPGRLFLMYGKNSPEAFWATGLIYGVMTGFALLLVYAFTFERDPKEVEYNDHIGSVWNVLPQIGSDVMSSMRIKTFRLHCVLMGVGGIFKNLTSGVFTYFVIFVLMIDPVVTANISSVTALASSIALLFFIGTCYKYGGPATYKISTVIVFGSLLGYYVLTTGISSGLVILLTVFAVINTIGRTGIDYVPVFQLAFMADIDEAVTGQRREGLFSGVNSLLSKVATAVEAALLGFVLQAFGFKAGVTVQPDSAVLGISILTMATPFLLLGITWIASSRLKLNKERHKILVDEVHRLRAGGSMEDATVSAKTAFKELTGWDYKDCWGNNNVVGKTCNVNQTTEKMA